MLTRRIPAGPAVRAGPFGEAISRMPATRSRSSGEIGSPTRDLGEIRETLEEIRETLKVFGAPVPGSEDKDRKTGEKKVGAPRGSDEMARLVETLRRQDAGSKRTGSAQQNAGADPAEDPDPVFRWIHERLEVLAQTIGQDADSLSAQASRIESLLTHESRPARLGAVIERIAAVERGVAEIGDALLSEFSTAGRLTAEIASLRTLIGEAFPGERLRGIQSQLETLQKSGLPPSEAAKATSDRLEARFTQFAALFEEQTNALDSKLNAFDGALTEIRWALANRPGVDRLERKVTDLCRRMDALLEQGVGPALERSLDEFLVKIDRSRDEMARIARDDPDATSTDTSDADRRSDVQTAKRWHSLDDPMRLQRTDGFFGNDFSAPAVTAQDRLGKPGRAPSLLAGDSAPRPGVFRRRVLAVASAAILLAFAAWLAFGLLPRGSGSLQMLDAIRAGVD